MLFILACELSILCSSHLPPLHSKRSHQIEAISVVVASLIVVVAASVVAVAVADATATTG